MNILAIDTTNTRLTVVLITEHGCFSEETEVGKSGHSALLMPTVDKVLKDGGVNVTCLNAVAAVVGPGSFTGIRIGVAAMTALAFATGARRIAVTSFELIAYNRRSVLAAVDAGHGNVYAAECENGRVTAARFISAEENFTGIDEAEYKPCCTFSEALAGVVKAKAESGEYCEVLAPFYMRKSQAEREKDEI